MNRQKKVMLCGAFIFILSLSFITGCVGKQETSDTAVISAAELKDIATSGKVSLTPDSPCQTWEIPKSEEAILSKVTSWLQQAKRYKGKIPQSEYTGASAGYNGPAILYISTSNKHRIVIKPAYYSISEMTEHGKMYKNHYITDVLYLKYDEQISYIQSSQLYDWLKNDKWETEFEIEH